MGKCYFHHSLFIKLINELLFYAPLNSDQNLCTWPFLHFTVQWSRNPLIFQIYELVPFAHVLVLFLLECPLLFFLPFFFFCKMSLITLLLLLITEIQDHQLKLISFCLPIELFILSCYMPHFSFLIYIFLNPLWDCMSCLIRSFI